MIQVRDGEFVTGDGSAGRRPERWIREPPGSSRRLGPSPRPDETIPPPSAAVVRRSWLFAERNVRDSVGSLRDIQRGALVLIVDRDAGPVKSGQTDTVRRTA